MAPFSYQFLSLWGNEIFEGKDINSKWDGRVYNNSTIAQQDVYVWKVVLTDIFNEEHSYIGTVSIVK